MTNTLMSKMYSDMNQWSCKICTFLNPILVYPQCKMCQNTDPLLIENNISQIISDNNNDTNQLSKISTSLAICDRYHQDELDAEKVFNTIISYCRQTKTNFVDDQFLPSSRSIDFTNDHSFQWLRISQIHPTSSRKNNQSNWSVYSSPSPSDIQQGTLGNCWLMAALTLIAEQPKVLERIVLTKDVNEQGVYLIRICHNGLWKTIIVDDYFPCRSDNQLAYSQAHRYQLYVPLIEKACAKLFGSYSELCGGHTEEGLQLLTGAPCDRIDINFDDNEFNSDIIWAKLLSACEFRLLIGAATGRTDVSEDEYRQVHINANHAFSILAACSLPDISMQFVLVRDPHAKTNYREPLITPIILAELNSSIRFRPPSGAFWISWPVFLQFFTSIAISSYISDYYDVRQAAQFTQSSKEPIPTFHFYVPKTSSVNISLIYHRQSRRLPCSHTQFFVLCDIKDRQMGTVGTCLSIIQVNRRPFTQWSGSLNPGYYILIPFSTTFWNEENRESQRDYTIVIHSNIQLDMQLVKEPATILTDCLIAIILKQNNRRVQDKYFYYYAIDGRTDFFIFIAENLSSTHYLNLDMDMSDSLYIQNSRQSFITHDCIPPNHRQIIIFTEWTHKNNQVAQFNYDFQYSHVKQSNRSISAMDIHRNDFHSYRPI